MRLFFLMAVLVFSVLTQASHFDFTFVRLKWNPRADLPSHLSEIHTWNADYPDADHCLTQSLSTVTAVRTNPKPSVIEVGSKELYQQSFAYIVEAGWVNFSKEETENLRNWLAKGGFLLVDDFHGPMEGFDFKAQEHFNPVNEWRQWMQQVRRMFPNVIETRQIYSPHILESYRGEFVVLRLTKDHPVFNQFFYHSEIPHVQGLRAKEAFNSNFEEGGQGHYVMGLFDPRGRLMMLMNYNMDVGDGWEFCKEAWKSEYGKTQVPFGLKLGINYVLYSLTH